VFTYAPVLVKRTAAEEATGEKLVFNTAPVPPSPQPTSPRTIPRNAIGSMLDVEGSSDGEPGGSLLSAEIEKAVIRLPRR
jgi:hypothetical protein